MAKMTGHYTNGLYAASRLRRDLQEKKKIGFIRPLTESILGASEQKAVFVKFRSKLVGAYDKDCWDIMGGSRSLSLICPPFLSPSLSSLPLKVGSI